jgi:hypothetical protein
MSRLAGASSKQIAGQSREVVSPNGYSAIWDVNPDGSLKDAIVIGPL